MLDLSEASNSKIYSKNSKHDKIRHLVQQRLQSLHSSALSMHHNHQLNLNQGLFQEYRNQSAKEADGPPSNELPYFGSKKQNPAEYRARGTQPT